MRGRAIDETIDAIRPPDEASRTAARALQLKLTKPAGSLGRLEELHVWAAGVFRSAAPPLPRKIIVVAAGDHGVADEGVSAYPQEVTAQMLANFLAGGAAVSVLARHAGAEVRVVDAGVRSDSHEPHVHVAKVRAGAGNIARGPAMSGDEAETLVARGIAFAGELCAAGPVAVALGDMGIANTTPAAAITSVLADVPSHAAAGRGTGIDDAGFERKVRAIEQAIAVNRPDATDPLDVLAKVGGCEIAFLAGVTLGAARRSAPIVLDGYPTTAAALIAAALAPASLDYMLASHISAEPGHRLALAQLGLRPLLDLELRLGEGTGAALALSLLDAALRIPREMATFDAAGVSRSDTETRPEA
ncbi:MAG: nicotinate-nucleotide--dimethylbenzimidazole phosphoribosyltransferase [Dehalococcoidia bacterium]